MLQSSSAFNSRQNIVKIQSSLRPLHTSRVFCRETPDFLTRTKNRPVCVVVPDKIFCREQRLCMIDPKNWYVCGGFRQIVGSRAWFDKSRSSIYHVGRFKMAAAAAGEKVEEVLVSEDSATWTLEKGDLLVKA